MDKETKVDTQLKVFVCVAYVRRLMKSCLELLQLSWNKPTRTCITYQE